MKKSIYREKDNKHKERIDVIRIEEKLRECLIHRRKFGLEHTYLLPSGKCLVVTKDIDGYHTIDLYSNNETTEYVSELEKIFENIYKHCL